METVDFEPRLGTAPLHSDKIAASLRSKTALRLKYEAEAGVIRRKLGDLESIRAQLGLSQRKMCQLLLVDPSAWSRWTRQGESAPPHIYRMLQWYLALQEKYPALDVGFWLNTVARTEDRDSNSELIEMREEIRQHRERVERLEQTIVTLMANQSQKSDRQKSRKARTPALANSSVGSGVKARLLKRLGRLWRRT